MPKVEGLVSQLQFFVSMAVTDKRLRLGEYFRDFVFGSVRILRSLPWLQSDTLAALVNRIPDHLAHRTGDSPHPSLGEYWPLCFTVRGGRDAADSGSHAGESDVGSVLGGDSARFAADGIAGDPRAGTALVGRADRAGLRVEGVEYSRHCWLAQSHILCFAG